MYIPTPEINQLTHDKRLQEECLDYVGKKGNKCYVILLKSTPMESFTRKEARRL